MLSISRALDITPRILVSILPGKTNQITMRIAAIIIRATCIFCFLFMHKARFSELIYAFLMKIVVT